MNDKNQKDKKISLKSTQSAFMNYLLGQSADFAEHVQPGGSIDVKTRMHIYANAYRARFVETIETDHEMLGLYLGDELFDKMAKGYIQTYPSQYTSLRNYADELPNYLANNQPFAAHPVIAELARFERALLVAFDARDVESIVFSDLTKLPPEKWPDVICRFHPSVQLFDSSWNSVDIWNALKKGMTPDAAKQQQVTWLVWRNSERLTQFQSIDTIEQTMLINFLNGKNFAEVCEDLSGTIPQQEIPTRAFNTLKIWFDRKLIIAI